jgi:hypothetical protein
MHFHALCLYFILQVWDHEIIPKELTCCAEFTRKQHQCIKQQIKENITAIPVL